MARQIWKFSVPPDGVIEMPHDAQLLSVQMQGGAPVLWAIVDPDATPTTQRVHIVGTGHDLSDDIGAFIDTFQVPDMGLVFHVFATTS